MLYVFSAPVCIIYLSQRLRQIVKIYFRYLSINDTLCFRSPQPSPSSRTAPSPRNQAAASPRGAQPSPHDLAASEMLLSQNHSNALHPHASPAGNQSQDGGNDVPAMTPQDQLSKFVEQLQWCRALLSNRPMDQIVSYTIM